MGTRLFNLALGPIALSFVGASGKEEIKKIKELHQEHSDKWMKYWLRYRDVEYRDLI
jgi:type IV secretion system protein VirB4